MAGGGRDSTRSASAPCVLEARTFVIVVVVVVITIIKTSITSSLFHDLQLTSTSVASVVTIVVVVMPAK